MFDVGIAAVVSAGGDCRLFVGVVVDVAAACVLLCDRLSSLLCVDGLLFFDVVCC